MNTYVCSREAYEWLLLKFNRTYAAETSEYPVNKAFMYQNKKNLQTKSLILHV